MFIKITKINPNQVDRAIQQVTAQGSSPKIPQSPTTIKKSGGSIDEGRATAAEPAGESSPARLITELVAHCRSFNRSYDDSPAYVWLRSNEITIKGKKYKIWIDGAIYDKEFKSKSTPNILLKPENLQTLEGKFLHEIQEGEYHENWLINQNGGINSGQESYYNDDIRDWSFEKFEPSDIECGNITDDGVNEGDADIYDVDIRENDESKIKFTAEEN